MTICGRQSTKKGCADIKYCQWAGDGTGDPPAFKCTTEGDWVVSVRALVSRKAVVARVCSTATV